MNISYDNFDFDLFEKDISDADIDMDIESDVEMLGVNSVPQASPSQYLLDLPFCDDPPPIDFSMDCISLSSLLDTGTNYNAVTPTNGSITFDSSDMHERMENMAAIEDIDTMVPLSMSSPPLTTICKPRSVIPAPLKEFSLSNFEEMMSLQTTESDQITDNASTDSSTTSPCTHELEGSTSSGSPAHSHKTPTLDSLDHKCPHCAQVFRSAENVKRHSMTHCISGGHLCPYCPGRFSKRGGLALHISRAHTSQNRNNKKTKGRKVKPFFRCSECGGQFTTKYSLCRHVRITHAKKREFKCDLCPATFATCHNVELHKFKVHLPGTNNY